MSYPTLMNAQRKWKKAAQVQEGVQSTIGYFVRRAKHASAEARRQLALSKGADPLLLHRERYHQAQMERASWMHSAKLLRDMTTERLAVRVVSEKEKAA